MMAASGVIASVQGGVAGRGATVRWPVPAETAVVLRLR